MHTKPSPSTIDSALQAQVDAQLLEQGAFSALDLLIDSGRLSYADYESWRRREIDLLDRVLMGNREKIRAQLEAAAAYARGIGLVEQIQDFHAWPPAGQTHARDAEDKPLRISADPNLQRLIAGRHAPAQSAPQMDLFFDNPIVALTNGIVRAVSARNAGEAQRQLDRLYAQAPNHADLAAFDRLLAALGHLDRAVDDPLRELHFMRELTPVARRLLGSQSRDLLSPLWRQLAEALHDRPFSPDNPELHRSFALSQAQDWPGVSECVLGEPGWPLHAALCLRLAQSSFHLQRRIEALTAWFHLCWHSPEQAAGVLEQRRQPDPGIAMLWQRFSDQDDEADPQPGDPALGAADFPAWVLLNEPGLVRHLGEDLPAARTPGEEHYRCIHRWIQTRRAGRRDEEIALRRTLQAAHPALFRCLKRSV